MEDIGLKTKQLLSNRIKDIQQAYKQIQKSNNNPSHDVKISYDDEMNTNFGNISNIQIPYEIQNMEFEHEEDIEEEIQENESFCSYILYFIIILLSFGYIGYHLSKEKVISVEAMNGITLGLLSGMIIVNLLWSSIKNN